MPVFAWRNYQMIEIFFNFVSKTGAIICRFFSFVFLVVMEQMRVLFSSIYDYFCYIKTIINIRINYKKGFSWITSAGFTALLISALYDYLTGSMNIIFIKSINNQYEFYLENRTPFDRIVNNFRVHVPPQKMIFEIIENIPATFTSQVLFFRTEIAYTYPQ